MDVLGDGEMLREGTPEIGSEKIQDFGILQSLNSFVNSFGRLSPPIRSCHGEAASNPRVSPLKLQEPTLNCQVLMPQKEEVSYYFSTSMNYYYLLVLINFFIIMKLFCS